MDSERPSPARGPGRVGRRRPSGWSDLAERIRRLSLLQLAALIVVGLLIVIVTVVVGRSSGREHDRRVSEQAFHVDLLQLRNDLRIEEARYWKRRAKGEPIPAEAATAATIGSQRATALAARDPEPDDAIKKVAAKDTVDALNALGRLLRDYSPQAAPPGRTGSHRGRTSPRGASRPSPKRCRRTRAASP